MTFRPAFLTYDDLRASADEFLSEYHPQGTVPVAIEEIVEFDLGMEVIPLEGLRSHVEAAAGDGEVGDGLPCDVRAVRAR